MLTIYEEILLLVIDEENGSFVRLPSLSLEFAIAGSLLMELALKNRIDSDLKKLFIIDKTPTGDPILDKALQQLTDSKLEGDGKYWVQRLAKTADDTRDEIIYRLVDKGILKVENKKILWVFNSRRYPLLDNKEVTEVRERIRAIIFSDDIPDPHDIAIIGLAHACNLLDHVFDTDQVKQVRNRIDQICKMELIGRAVLDSVRDIQNIEMMSLHYTRPFGM